MRKKLDGQQSAGKPLRGRKWLLFGAFVAAALLAVGVWQFTSSPATAKEAPEAEKVLAVQEKMPFQILIPAYLPKEFDRAGVDIKVNESGPGGEPMVQLAYRTGSGVTVFLREWVPVNPDMEILSSSRPIETKWGKGWLLKHGEGLGAIWVSIGPMRIALFTYSVQRLATEDLLAMAETLGPASNRQVFNFVVNKSAVKEMPPPPPVEIPVNEQGVQEFTLVVTPGGYDPLRFSVKKGVPVRMTFRQLGEVGCGAELIFPAYPGNPSALTLENEQDEKVLEWTPEQAGEFQFHCSHLMYRGILYVTE